MRSGRRGIVSYNAVSEAYTKPVACAWPMHKALAIKCVNKYATGGLDARHYVRSGFQQCTLADRADVTTDCAKPQYINITFVAAQPRNNCGTQVAARSRRTR